MKRTRLHNVADVLRWEGVMAESQLSALLALPCPRRVLGVDVPATIDGLTYEGLCRLWEVKDTRDLVVVGAEVVLHKGERAALRAQIIPMMGFANWLARELERVTELWGSIPSYHSPEEVMAGCSNLRFGVFGVADWYARRMGMQSHDDAMATPWVRIYQCMRNDAEVAEYQRRLNDILTKKNSK